MTLSVFSSAPGSSAEREGGKATSLHQLVAAGVPVPPGFVVAPDADLTHVERQLSDAVASLGGYPVAVRSSAQVEELTETSFAGQSTTNFKVTSLADLVESIARCRASQSNPPLTSHLEKNEYQQTAPEAAVLVQKVVAASIAGVTFSIHPETGREEHALVECRQALGAHLVSGQRSPTRYVVWLENSSVLERSAGAEDVTLDQSILHKLCRYALELQAHFGMPQRIEWVLDCCGEVWILHSRPVTRFHWRDDVDEFTNANFRDGGISARVCTPFMYSLYRNAFQESMQRYFVAIKLVPGKAAPQTWISRFYGRPYWSASAAKKALCTVPGYDEERFDQDVGIHKNYGTAGPIRTPRNLHSMLRALPVAFALGREFRRQLRRTENYGQHFLRQELDYQRSLESRDGMEDGEFFSLAVAVLRFHHQTNTDYLRTVYNHVNYQSEFKKLLDRIQAVIGEPVSLLVLMSGLRDVSHMKMQQGLLSLVHTAKSHGTASREWDEALREFLRTNYFHGDAELDISTPRWRECPERIRQMVEGIQQSGIEPKQPEATAREQAAQYSEEVRRIRAAFERSYWRQLRFEKSFSKRLKISRIYASRREQMREYSMRADDLVRRYLLEAGRRLHRRGWLRHQADVFMLHTDEMKALADDRVSGEQILGRSEFRDRMYRGYRMVEPPGELGRAVSLQVSASDVAELPDPTLLKGVGCSAGRVTAKARVLTALAESERLMPGEILVTRFTDPAWTPMLGLVAGLITEVGGLLSHGAVIAREYGLPAVLNVDGATEVIQTGQVLEIDGGQGTVKIVAHNQSSATARPGGKTVLSRIADSA